MIDFPARRIDRRTFLAFSRLSFGVAIAEVVLTCCWNCNLDV